jgi:hypothetical protein
MPAVSRPSSLSLLGDSCIERELNVAATNAERNRSIPISKSPRRESSRSQRATPSPPEFMYEKVDSRAKKGTAEVSKKIEDKYQPLALVDQESMDTPRSRDSRQDNGVGLSLGSIEDLIGNWANSIKDAIFRANEAKQSFAVETREHNGDQLVLM